MHRFLYIAIVSLFFCSCQSEQDKAVRNWELLNNSCETLQIEIEETPKPYVAIDSIQVLKVQYEALQAERILQLEIELDTLKRTILLKQDEYLTLTNETMKRYFKKGIDRMEARAVLIERNVDIYQNKPELTQLQVMSSMVDFYAKDSSELLGYVYQVQFVGKQGALDERMFYKKYLFDTLKVSILAEL